MIGIERRRVAPILMLGAALVFGCNRPSVDIEEPPTMDFDALDSDVAEMLRSQVERAMQDPGNAELRSRLGMAYEANEIIGSARTAYEQATRLDPSEPRWWYHLARVRAAQGDEIGALTDLERAIELAPDYGPAYYRRGVWMLALGRLEEAEQAFRDSANLEHTQVAGRVGLARVYLQNEQEEKSVELLEQLLTANITHSYLYYLLGTAYRQLGRIDEAKRMLEGANPSPALYPDPWEEELDQFQVGYGADFRRAMGLRRAGRYDEAIPIMEQLRQRQPNDVILLSNLGAAYVDVGRIDEARAALVQALEVDPNHFAANLNLSKVYELRREFDVALVHAQRAVRSNPLLGRAHEREGVVLAKLGRHDEARAALDKAREYGSNGAEGLLVSGAMYADRGEWEAAIADLEAALRIMPQSFEGLAMLAIARGRVGNIDGARQALRRAERIHPEHPALPGVRRRVEQLAAQD
jgi:tetratricopeptide (TPR) repeat protein